MVIDMRNLLFFLLFFYSYFVFAQDVPPPPANCPASMQVGCISTSGMGAFQSWCQGQGNLFAATPSSGSCSPNNQPMQCAAQGTCTCPEGFKYNVVINAGLKWGSCIPDLPDVPPPDPLECDESEKVYDPVSGAMVCPASGDGGSSSSASSQTCVVPGDYNGDCIEDSQQGSSANNSNPASSPNTSSPNTSSPSTGGGDDGENPSTGGGGGGGGGGSTGGASGSASNTSSGSNSSWTPNSGYGNWIPVDEDSNCPNKYKDNAGQWWCSGATNQGSAGSASGVCDPTATNYWSCINSGSAGSAASAGSASSDNSESKLTEKGDELIEGLKEDIDSDLDDFEKGYTDDIDQFVNDGVPFENEPSAIKSLLISFLPVSSSCNPPTLRILGESIELDCEYFNLFKQWFGWFLAIVTAYQIWQMAIRPVER